MKHSSPQLILIGGLAVIALVVVFLISFKTTNVEPRPVASPAETVLETPEEAESPTPPSDLLSQGELQLIEKVDWKLNTFSSLGFAVSAPAVFSWETQDISRGLFGGEEFGDHGFASLVHAEEGVSTSAAVVSTATTLPINARGGYWGDIVNNLEGPSISCEDFPAPTDYVDELWSCTSFENALGHTVVHLTQTWDSFVTHPGLINLYILAHPDPDVRAVILSDQRLLPQDHPNHSEIVDHLASSGFTTIQETRNLVRTMVETIDLIEIDSF